MFVRVLFLVQTEKEEESDGRIAQENLPAKQKRKVEHNTQ
jgi:hypothetical protein